MNGKLFLVTVEKYFTGFSYHALIIYNDNSIWRSDGYDTYEEAQETLLAVIQIDV